MTTPIGDPGGQSPHTPDLPELEDRLRASWERSLARAGDDLADGVLVRASLEAGTRRRPAWRAMATALAGIAALLVLVMALAVGAGGRREAQSVSPDVGVTTPTPGATTDTADGIPVLDPGVPFPATVDGQPVIDVGDAELRLAAATDDAPIYVSGWLLGPDLQGCPDFDLGSPAPNGVLWKPCTAVRLREDADGGAELAVHRSFDALASVTVPERTHAMPVLFQVHAHDAGCTTADCAQLAVLDRVVAYGAARIAPTFLGLTPPPNGIPLPAAVDAALAYAESTKMALGAPVVLLSAHAGPRALVDDQAGSDELDWVWAVRLASDDGYQVTDVFVDYRDGVATGSSGSMGFFP